MTFPLLGIWNTKVLKLPSLLIIIPVPSWFWTWQNSSIRWLIFLWHFLLLQQQQTREMTNNQAQKLKREHKNIKKGQHPWCLLHSFLWCLHQFLHHLLECLLYSPKHLWSMITVITKGQPDLNFFNLLIKLSLLSYLSGVFKKSPFYIEFSFGYSSFYLTSLTSQCKSAAWVVLSYFVVAQSIYQFLPFWCSIFPSISFLNFSKKGIYVRVWFLTSFILFLGLKNPWWFQLLWWKFFFFMWWWWIAAKSPPRAKVNKRRPMKNFLHFFFCWCILPIPISKVWSLERTWRWLRSVGGSWKAECSEAVWTYLQSLRQYF